MLSLSKRKCNSSYKTPFIIHTKLDKSEGVLFIILKIKLIKYPQTLLAVQLKT